MMRYMKIFTGVAVMALGWVGLSAPSQANSGDYCREYTRTVFIGNQREEAYGTACLRPDGQWEIMNESDRMPVSYRPLTPSTRTVFIREPSQVVYYNRRPTKVVFIGKPHRSPPYYHARHHRYDRHDHGKRGRGHGHR